MSSKNTSVRMVKSIQRRSISGYRLPHSGQSLTSTTKENTEMYIEMEFDNRRLGVRKMALELDSSYMPIHNILTNSLSMSYV